MKKALSIIALLLTMSVAMAQDGTLRVTFKFANVEEGYDHVTKTEVYIDGEKVGESAEVNETAGATFSVDVPMRKVEITVVNWALYEGNWEEHTIANNYSIDCTYEATHTMKAKNKLFLLFDIDSQTHASWKKMPKVKKPKG